MTDLGLLNDGRVKSEMLIYLLFDKYLHVTKPRNYREKTRKEYLLTVQKKSKTRKIIRREVGQQLRYLRRNIKIIHFLLDSYQTIPLKIKN